MTLPKMSQNVSTFSRASGSSSSAPPFRSPCARSCEAWNAAKRPRRVNSTPPSAQSSRPERRICEATEGQAAIGPEPAGQLSLSPFRPNLLWKRRATSGSIGSEGRFWTTSDMASKSVLAEWRRTPVIKFPVCSMHVVSRLSRNRNGRGAVRTDLAHHLFKEQRHAGRFRPREKAWRVWQEASSHVPVVLGLAAGSMAQLNNFIAPV
jgi:hypothetical protein